MNEQEALLLLNRVSSLDAKKVQVLLDVFLSPGEIVKRKNIDLIEKTTPFGRRLSRSIIDSLKKFDAVRELEQCNKKGIKLISFWDANYPALLKEIHDPPVLLYVKGSLSQSDFDCLSIVGSRRASFYGLNMAKKFAYEFAMHGLTVVSGMALGIDGVAHDGAIQARGRTVAVLGCGVDVVYPRENFKLYDKIISTGAVISEYSLGSLPRTYNFPKRNRIIAGMAKGTLVIEAAQRSGSLITARLALEEGREVFSVPGKIDNPQSMGTNSLIKEGAMLVTESKEILELLFPAFKKTKVNKDELILDDNEKKIFTILKGKSHSLEEISTKVNVDKAKLFSLLTSLELKKVIKRCPNGCYIAGRF